MEAPSCGEILQLSNEGIDALTVGNEMAAERCRNMRWLCLGLGTTDDVWGEKCLTVNRLDNGSSAMEQWSRRFLESAHV
uniref:Uncharacterized protein n=1 Tax=viral metagenome TaxID=1070528 RepID=A0A6M3JA44_9ZZZZ